MYQHENHCKYFFFSLSIDITKEDEDFNELDDEDYDPDFDITLWYV